MKKKIAYIVSAVVLIFLSILVYDYYKMGSRNLVKNIISKKDLINILVAGRKNYKNNTFKFFALVTINTANRNIGVTFIPPQFKINMNSSDEVKQISEVEFSDFEIIRSNIKDKLKLDVPFFVKIYSDDVVRFVNLIDGIDLFKLDQEKCVDNVSFGLNYMDGRKVYQYINCAEENSIFIKYDRILDLIQTLYHTDKKMELINEVKFISKIVDNVKTNLLPQEVVSIAGLIKDKGTLYSTVLPGNYNQNYYDVDELSYKTYQQEFLTKIVVKHEGELNSKIRILNGTNVSGLARKLRNSLMRDGLNVVEFSSSPYPFMNDSIIISRTCDYRSVEKISEITGINKIYFVTDTRLLNNILIIIGGDMAK